LLLAIHGPIFIRSTIHNKTIWNDSTLQVHMPPVLFIVHFKCDARNLEKYMIRLNWNDSTGNRRKV